MKHLMSWKLVVLLLLAASLAPAQAMARQLLPDLPGSHNGAAVSQPPGPGQTEATGLSFSPSVANLTVGSTANVYVVLGQVTDLYGYQFEVHYNPALVSATATFVNTFFDTATQAAVPPGWGAACAAGVCRLAASKLNPAGSSSGAGVLARITFQGLAPGQDQVTFSGDILANRDGSPLAHGIGACDLTVHAAANLMHVSDVTLFEWPPLGLVVARVTVVDQTGSPVPSVFVGGQWRLPGGSWSRAWRLTNASGTATFATPKTGSGVYGLRVLQVWKSGWIYDPGANGETWDYVIVP